MTRCSRAPRNSADQHLGGDYRLNTEKWRPDDNRLDILRISERDNTLGISVVAVLKAGDTNHNFENNYVMHQA